MEWDFASILGTYFLSLPWSFMIQSIFHGETRKMREREQTCNSQYFRVKIRATGNLSMAFMLAPLSVEAESCCQNDLDLYQTYHHCAVSGCTACKPQWLCREIQNTTLIFLEVLLFSECSLSRGRELLIELVVLPAVVCSLSAAHRLPLQEAAHAEQAWFGPWNSQGGYTFFTYLFCMLRFDACLCWILINVFTYLFWQATCRHEYY